MTARAVSLLLLALAVGTACLAYLSPANVWRWAMSISLCQ